MKHCRKCNKYWWNCYFQLFERCTSNSFK